MKNKIYHLLFAVGMQLMFSSGMQCFCQTLSPHVIATGGGYATGGGNSLSFTIGEPFSTMLSAGSLILSEGEQQPEIDLLTGNILPLSYCAGSIVSVPFAASGYFGPANIFTSQLSDAAGSFAAPVTIGSLTGTGSGSISSFIPLSTVPGIAYRIRVVSSHSMFTGRDNLTDIVITASCCNISLSGLVTHVTCHNGNNGAILLSSSNITGTAAYVWSDGNTLQDRSGLGAGTYSVTVTYAPGCSLSQGFVITQPAALALNALPVNVSCRGAANGSVSLSPTGNSAPYSFQWNNGSTTQNRSSLAPGTYTVTVNDANLCGSVMQSFVITQPATNLIINTSKTDVRCNGALSGAATASPAGGTAPYSFSWNTIPVKTTAAVTGLSAGIYTCTVTDANDCTKNAIISITQPPLIVVMQNQSNVTFPGGNNGSASVSVSGGTPGYTYSWNTVPVKTTASVTGLTAGTYKCSITDSKGCPVKVTFIITQPVAKAAGGIQDMNAFKALIYPNPSTGLVSIEINGTADKGQVTVKLIDVAGREVYSKEMAWKPGGTRVFDFTSVESGIYHIQIITANGIVIEKLIIQ